jgi:uncharacterized protein (TIGR01244 family)
MKFRLFAIVLLVGVTAAAQSQVTKETLPGARNVSRVETTVICAGATGPEAMPEIRKMGFVAVVNFRLATEEGANIPAAEAAAKAAGLKYFHIPFDGAAPDPAVADQFLSVMRQPGNQPAYIHCASANRASAMWFIKRVELDGWDVEKAMAEAVALGLVNEAHKKFVLNYVQTH